MPGSEDLDVERCLATLDTWTALVKYEKERHLYKYYENPAEYENSEGFFRMMMLVTVLQKDCGVHYNPERIREVDFTKSQDLFIHGMIGSENGGTCVSMPVIYTAVARRLGYPVHLVTANGHVFCRWDSPDDRLNIEATSQGISSYDDVYYMTFPKPITKAAVDAGHFLKSLDVSESFAVFLAARGHCLQDNGQREEAHVAYAMAAEKNPNHPVYQHFLAQVMGIRPNITQHMTTLKPPTYNQRRPMPNDYSQPQNVWKPALPPSSGAGGIVQQPQGSQP